MAKSSRVRRSAKKQVSRSGPIDIHVGARVRLRRNLLGISQEKLGRAVGVICQQIQKYEKGTDRIGASRLFNLGRALDVPVSFFFEDLFPPATALDFDVLSKRETIKLVRAYYRVTDPQLRKRVLDLLKAIGKTS